MIGSTPTGTFGVPTAGSSPGGGGGAASVGGEWRADVTQFMRSKLYALDGEPMYTDYGDAGTTWTTMAGTVQAGNYWNGVALFGGVTGLNIARPTGLTTLGMTPAITAGPWGMAASGSQGVAGATVTGGFLSMAVATGSASRLTFGYKGALSLTNYCVWAEDLNGNVLSVTPLITTASVVLSQQANQTFLLISDGFQADAYYAGPGVPVLSATYVGTFHDWTGLDVRIPWWPQSFNRTSAGGNELTYVGALLAQTQRPQ